jgi:hypothetical protein
MARLVAIPEKAARARALVTKALFAHLTGFVVALGLTADASAYCDHAFRLEEQASPDNSWIFERYSEGGCSSALGSDIPGYLFVLRRTTEAPAPERQSFLTLADSNSIVVRWLDTDHFRIARPIGFPLPNPPSVFHGIKLSYDEYTDNPDDSWNPSFRKLLIRSVVFRYKSDFKEHGLPARSSTCNLYVSTGIGDREDLFMRLSTVKYIDSHGGPLELGKKREQQEQSHSSLLIAIRHQEMELEGLITATSVSFLPIREPSSRLISITTTLPSQTIVPREQFVWDLNHAELEGAIAKIRSGPLVLKLGSWLGNYEIIYEDAHPNDPEDLKEFARCVAANEVVQPNKH